MTISFNPAAVGNFPGSFQAQSQGYIQGYALDSPSVIIDKLRAGLLASTETLPMWGGLPVSVTIPGSTAPQLPVLARSTANAITGAGSVRGFSVFNQAANMVQTPSSRVPTSSPGMTVNYFELGSGARIVVQADPALIATLAAGASLDNLQLQWDFVNARLTAFTSGTALPVLVERYDAVGNSKTVSYNSGTGFTSWAAGTYAAVIII